MVYYSCRKIDLEKGFAIDSEGRPSISRTARWREIDLSKWAELVARENCSGNRGRIAVLEPHFDRLAFWHLPAGEALPGLPAFLLS